MARIFSTPAAEAKALSFMHEVLVAGGLHKSEHSNNAAIQAYSRFKQGAEVICKELTERNFDNIDVAIDQVSRFRGVWSPAGTFTVQTDFVAKSIVFFAAQIGLYWNDTIQTAYEIDEFKKTLLGKAVFKYGQYVSAIKAPKQATNRASRSSGSSGQAPKNNYKQSGPQSANARGLIGNPGDKVLANGNEIYRIIADKVGKNTPNAFIKPLSKAGESQVGENKVFFSSGNGYTDCTCFFDDPNDAQSFLDTMINNGLIPSNIVNPRVTKRPADPNGYFLVKTECGQCAISAKTLNEALAESLTEQKTEEALEAGWNRATKDYTKEELNELHAWMRRD